MKEIAIILPVYNRVGTTLQCLHRLDLIDSKKYLLVVIVIDDGSTDGTEIKVKEKFPKTKVLKGDGNLWWAGGVNKGLEYIKNNIPCNYILILNDDTNFNKNTLDELFEVIEQKKRVVCGSIVMDEESGLIYNAGQRVSKYLKVLKPIYKGHDIHDHADEIIECDSIGTRFVLMPKRIINDIGLFDKKKFTHGYSDYEYFLRASQNGYKILVVANSRITTLQNKNYMQFRLIDESLIDYLKLFFIKNTDSNLRYIFYKSIVHKNIFLGAITFIKEIASHLRWILYKMFLPKSLFIKIIKKKWII